MQLYAQRTQIEETFRDLRCHRWGFSLRYARCHTAARLEILLLLARSPCSSFGWSDWRLALSTSIGTSRQTPSEDETSSPHFSSAASCSEPESTSQTRLSSLRYSRCERSFARLLSTDFVGIAQNALLGSSQTGTRLYGYGHLIDVMDIVDPLEPWRPRGAASGKGL